MDNPLKAAAAAVLALGSYFMPGPPMNQKIILGKRRQSSKPHVPPPNPKTEHRKMLKVRDMQARKKRRNSRWRILRHSQ